MSEISTGDVASPCRRVCRPSEPGGPCVACLRSREEIRGWFGFSNERKRAIVNDLPRRARERAEARGRARAGATAEMTRDGVDDRG